MSCRGMVQAADHDDIVLFHHLSCFSFLRLLKGSDLLLDLITGIFRHLFHLLVCKFPFARDHSRDSYSYQIHSLLFFIFYNSLCSYFFL